MSLGPRRVWAELLALAAMAAVPLGAGPFLGRVPWRSDIANTFHPLRSFTHDSLARGETPWWNPLVACGVPHAADPQVGFWYPLSWIFDRMDPGVAIGAEIYVHLLITCLTAWAFAWVRGRSAPARLLSAREPTRRPRPSGR